MLGAVGSRTTGIYFLMLTLTYAVIGYYVFGQVTSISGFGGITGVNPPAFFDTHPVRLYYAVLVSVGGRLRRLPRAAPDTVRPDPRGHSRRPGADELARVQRAAAPHAGVRHGRLRRWARRRHQHLVERPDRSQLGQHRCDSRSVRCCRHRRDQPPRRRLARRLRVRRRQQLHAIAPARRPHRDHRGPLQHGGRRRRADHRRRLAERPDGTDHRRQPTASATAVPGGRPHPTLSTTTMEEST